MTYTFQQREPVGEGLRRIVEEQARKALQELQLKEDSPHEAVHQARKHFKKIRAVLRLARKPLGRRYAEENQAYRAMGRALSAARDQEAMMETLDALAGSASEALDGALLARVREALDARQRRLSDSSPSLEQQAAQVRQALQPALARIAQWQFPEEEFDLLENGLRKIYRQGGQAMRRAHLSGDPIEFHEWRKRVKDHWYHARLFAPVWPDLMGGHAQSLRHLSDLLGKHHDIVVFGEMLAQAPELARSEDQQRLLVIFQARLRELEEEAHPVGRRIYAEQPRAFERRMRAYWKVWRQD